MPDFIQSMTVYHRRKPQKGRHHQTVSTISNYKHVCDMCSLLSTNLSTYYSKTHGQNAKKNTPSHTNIHSLTHSSHASPATTTMKPLKLFTAQTNTHTLTHFNLLDGIWSASAGASSRLLCELRSQNRSICTACTADPKSAHRIHRLGVSIIARRSALALTCAAQFPHAHPYAHPYHTHPLKRFAFGKSIVFAGNVRVMRDICGSARPAPKSRMRTFTYA